MASVKNRLWLLLVQKYGSKEKMPNQDWLAEQMELTENQLSRWINNKISRFDNKPVTNICRFLGCQVGDLLYVEWNGERQPEREPA